MAGFCDMFILITSLILLCFATCCIGIVTYYEAMKRHSTLYITFWGCIFVILLFCTWHVGLIVVQYIF